MIPLTKRWLLAQAGYAPRRLDPARIEDSRGPFVTPKPQGARDLSRHAEAKRTDPARIEAERKAREIETQKLGRAIQITNRRGQP